MKKIVPLNISIILATYNWPNALQAVLCALAAQKTTHLFEIIVADDGSNSETAQVICNFKQHNSINILHIWQPDVGFRLAAIRNKAILASRGDYILFLDGDCIPRENFIERHWQLAEWKTLVMGNRVLLNHEFTKTVLLDSVPLHQWSFWQWCWARLHRKCNRIAPILSLPAWLRFKSNTRWQRAKGCNLGIWKADLLQVNGWEENFTGWGYEDSDMVIRLLRANVHSKSARFYIPVFHLWHRENDRTKERDNWLLLKNRQNSKQICAEKGLNQYTSKNF